MSNQSFSKRHGFAPDPDPVPVDSVPGWVREEFGVIVEEYSQYVDSEISGGFKATLYQWIRPLYWKVIGVEPARNPWGSPFVKYFPELIEGCEWWRFYDIGEAIYELFEKEAEHDIAEEFSDKVNELFSREELGWKFKDGHIERALLPMIIDTIEEACTLIEDPRFKGPDEQFEKALRHLNKRPDPDYANCVKDAVGAVEATLRILAKNEKLTLSQVIKQEPFSAEIHGALKGSLNNLYGYRGDAPGVAHGQAGPSTTEAEEAELILSQCAAWIIYLHNKFAKTLI